MIKTFNIEAVIDQGIHFPFAKVFEDLHSLSKDIIQQRANEYGLNEWSFVVLYHAQNHWFMKEIKPYLNEIYDKEDPLSSISGVCLLEFYTRLTELYRFLNYPEACNYDFYLFIFGHSFES